MNYYAISINNNSILNLTVYKLWHESVYIVPACMDYFTIGP